MKRTPEQRLLEFVGADTPPQGRETADWRRHSRTVRRLLREVKRAAADRAVAAYEADRTVIAANPQRALSIRRAIMEGK